MSQEAMRSFVENLTQSSMQSQFPNVPVKFPNVKFLQPETAWIALTILEGSAISASIGQRGIDRHVGFLQFDVLVPKNTGTVLAGQICDYLGTRFRRRSDSLSDGSQFHTKTPETRYMGDESGFGRMIVRIAYWRDDNPPN